MSKIHSYNPHADWYAKQFDIRKYEEGGSFKHEYMEK